METILEHATLATKMYKNKIDFRFIKQFSLQEIDACCDRIKNRKMLSEKGEQALWIQKELIKNEKFIDYLIEIYNNELENNGLEFLMQQIEEHNEKITEYPIQNVVSVLKNEDLSYDSYYAYLKYFINRDSSKRKQISRNLNTFYHQDKVKIEELSPKMLDLFESDYLDNCNLLPLNNIKKVYESLIENVDLRKLIEFLNRKNFNIGLDIHNFTRVNDNANEIYPIVQSISKSVTDDEIMYGLLRIWSDNGCNVYDLKIIEKKIKEVESQKLEIIFKNRTGYINFIYGDKLKKVPFEYLNRAREELIIYAITNNKKSFLKLIDEHMQEFLEVSSSSILYDDEFYMKYFNINELTVEKLAKISQLTTFQNMSHLKEQFYTFEEVNTLSNVDVQYIELYNKLLDLKIDDRLLRIKQCVKKDLLKNVEIEHIEKIAQKIKQKPIYQWLESDFKAISDIKAVDIVQILTNYEVIGKFISELKNRNELTYLLRNINEIREYNDLQSVKDNIEQIDRHWEYLKDQLNFSDDFLQKYKQNIKEFILNNYAEIAYLYYVDSQENVREAFKLIIKSEIMGEFKKLKYHTDDLKEEINFKLNQEQINEWTNHNSKILEGSYDVGEYDDFYHTMILGEQPQRTCLCYNDGMYNRCLLACFDSNKKILYAKVNGKIVARAMVRLTKGAYNKIENGKTLSFFDVEKDTLPGAEGKQENLTIFLEKAYIAGISGRNEREVKRLFIKLLEEKARKMNALLVLSNYYYDDVENDYIKTNYYMYISKSKSSSQYLDSLSGQATVSDEGEYRCNSFFIWKPKNIETSVFDESIFATQ